MAACICLPRLVICCASTAPEWREDGERPGARPWLMTALGLDLGWSSMAMTETETGGTGKRKSYQGPGICLLLGERSACDLLRLLLRGGGPGNVDISRLIPRRSGRTSTKPWVPY